MKRPLFWFFLILITGFVVRVLYIGFEAVDLAPDEAYYWQWSCRLDWCYYSKGPMVAWIIWLGTQIFGHTPMGVRFPSVALSILTLLISLRLYQDLFPQQKTGWVLLAIFFHTIPIFLVGGVIMTIDPILCAAWMGSLWMLHRAVRQNQSWAWAGLALAVGIGILAKYTMLLFLPTILLYLALSKENRICLKYPAHYLLIFLF